MLARCLIVAPLALAGALLPARAQDAGAAPELPVVQGIVVEGERRYTEAQIAGVLGQKVGAPLDPAALDQGIRRLGTTFQVRALVARRDVPGGVDLLGDLLFYSTLEGRSEALSAAKGTKVWATDRGEFNPAITDGETLYLNDQTGMWAYSVRGRGR